MIDRRLVHRIVLRRLAEQHHAVEVQHRDVAVRADVDRLDELAVALRDDYGDDEPGETSRVVGQPARDGDDERRRRPDGVIRPIDRELVAGSGRELFEDVVVGARLPDDRRLRRVG